MDNTELIKEIKLYFNEEKKCIDCDYNGFTIYIREQGFFCRNCFIKFVNDYNIYIPKFI
jgi:hypothetical protein